MKWDVIYQTQLIIFPVINGNPGAAQFRQLLFNSDPKSEFANDQNLDCINEAKPTDKNPSLETIGSFL